MNLMKMNDKNRLVHMVQVFQRNRDQKHMQIGSLTAQSVCQCGFSFLEVHNSLWLKIRVHL